MARSRRNRKRKPKSIISRIFGVIISFFLLIAAVAAMFIAFNNVSKFELPNFKKTFLPEESSDESEETSEGESIYINSESLEDGEIDVEKLIESVEESIERSREQQETDESEKSLKEKSQVNESNKYSEKKSGNTKNSENTVSGEKQKESESAEESSEESTQETKELTELQKKEARRNAGIIDEETEEENGPEISDTSKTEYTELEKAEIQRNSYIEETDESVEENTDTDVIQGPIVTEILPASGSKGVTISNNGPVE